MQAKQTRSDILYMTTLDTGRCSQYVCTYVYIYMLFVYIYIYIVYLSICLDIHIYMYMLGFWGWAMVVYFICGS